MKAIRISQYGGADVLRFEDIDAPEPGDRTGSHRH